MVWKEIHILKYDTFVIQNNIWNNEQTIGDQFGAKVQYTDEIAQSHICTGALCSP